MPDNKLVLVEGKEINDERIDEIVDALFSDDEEGNAESTSPEE